MSNYQSPCLKAFFFAREAHKDQKRKYTNQPYFDHVAEVAGILASVTQDQEALAIAYLHDVIEDCGVSYQDLELQFGKTIADGVLALSDLEEGNRATRKQLSRERLAKQNSMIQTIKCADLISNTSSIVGHDPKFAKVYLQEKKDLLKVLTNADNFLWLCAYGIANEGLKKISEVEQ